MPRLASYFCRSGLLMLLGVVVCLKELLAAFSFHLGIKVFALSCKIFHPVVFLLVFFRKGDYLTQSNVVFRLGNHPRDCHPAYVPRND